MHGVCAHSGGKGHVDRTRIVSNEEGGPPPAPLPVLSGHAASLTPY